MFGESYYSLSGGGGGGGGANLVPAEVLSHSITLS